MKIQELISELQKYDNDLEVAIMNIHDDTSEAGTSLKANAIEKVETYDEFEDRLTGEHFVAIGYKCSICNR